MNVNEYADMTNEEFTAARSGKKPAAARPFATARLSTTKLSSLPDRLDWRETEGVVTETKNQGGCGSCWAFSATESLESMYAIATNSTAPKLSTQQMVSCSPNPDHCGGSGGCDGSTQELGYNYTQQVGLSLEKDYPYEGRTGTCETSKISAAVKHTGYEMLPMNNYTSLITAVHEKGPIAISIAAGGLGWQLYGGGIYDDKHCGFVQDHGVGLVGYGSDTVGVFKKTKEDYWLVRNSWGKGWGEKGYIRIQRFGEGKEPCGMDKQPQDGSACTGDTKPVKYCGLCAILSDSSYPTGVSKA